MKRIVIAPPVEVLERLSEIAASERRTPKEQIEYILIEHVREHEGTASDKEAANAR